MQVRGDVPHLQKKSRLVFDGSTDCGKPEVVAFPLLEGQVPALLVQRDRWDGLGLSREELGWGEGHLFVGHEASTMFDHLKALATQIELGGSC